MRVCQGAKGVEGTYHCFEYYGLLFFFFFGCPSGCLFDYYLISIHIKRYERHKRHESYDKTKDTKV